MIATAHRTTLFRPRTIRGHAELPPQGRQAHHGLGMATATRQMRDRVERIMKEGLACDCCSDEIKALFNEWIANRENTLKTKEVADRLIPLMEKCGCDICKQLLELRHSLVKKSQWIFGGDGRGYDIGIGSLDHVLASCGRCLPKAANTAE